MREITPKSSRTWSRVGQRGTICGVALPEILEAYKNSYVLTADLGRLSGLDRVKQNFPERFLNVGIAEQNMIGVAAGLAFEENIVFATTYATFLSMRCYEQIRHNLGYQKANVKLIGSTSGLAMGMSGNTHYAYEDIALMRVIPHMVIVSPADAAEAYLAVHEAAKHKGPVYIRLSGNLNEPILYQAPYDFQFGKAVVMKQGYSIALIATGGSVDETLKASEILEKDGYDVAVVNMHTIKPLDIEIIKTYLNADLIVTIEEHRLVGGLGSAVAEYLASLPHTPQLLRIGLSDTFVHPAEYTYLKEENGLSAYKIYEYVKKTRESMT
jgi:transketolase